VNGKFGTLRRIIYPEEPKVTKDLWSVSDSIVRVAMPPKILRFAQDKLQIV